MKRFIFTLSATLFLLLELSAQDLAVPSTQRSLVVKHTATWCPICGGQPWDVQKYFVESLSDKAVVLAAHISPSSRLYSATAVELLNNFPSVIYQPEFFHNVVKVTGSNNAIRDTITARVNRVAEFNPGMQTALQVTYNPTTDTLKVRTNTRFFRATEGMYHLSILLLEREVTEQQAARSSNEKHRNVLRESLSGNAYGTLLAGGSVPEDAEFERDIAVKWNNRYDLNNIEIVVALWRRTGTRFEFENANATAEVQAEQVSSVPAADILGNRFRVVPTATFGNAQIWLDLPQASNSAELIIFDQLGRAARTIFAGNLPAGEQFFPLQRSSAEAPGMYFVRFRSGNMVATRRVVFY